MLNDPDLWDCVSVEGNDDFFFDIHDIDYYGKSEDGVSAIKIMVSAPDDIDLQSFSESVVFNWNYDLISSPNIKEIRENG